MTTPADAQPHARERSAVPAGAPGYARWLPLAGALLGFAWFLHLGGWNAFDPTNLRWLVGDHAQHALGWLFFRHEPWALPLGRIESLMHPVGTTVGFTDSNPWVSLLLKPLSPWLPVNFQFIGPWLALCFALQGFWGVRIMEAFTASAFQRILGGALFVLAPPLLGRVAHDTLAAHWLLLGSIWLHVRPAGTRRNAIGWAFAFNFIAAGVHPYLAMMLMPLTLALLFRLSAERQLRPLAACALGLGLIAQNAAVFWLLGYLGSSEQLSENGFGFFSADVLTFFNPMSYSRWLPGFKVGEGQYEGFAFLGAGVIGLALVLVSVAVVRRERPRLAKGTGPLVLAAGLTGVFALSSVISVAGYEVLTVRGLYDPFNAVVEPMRASGRFIWPLHYVVLTGILALAVRSRFTRPAVTSALLLTVVVVQAGEVKPGARFVGQEWRGVRSTVWRSLDSTYRHLVLYPGYFPVRPPACESSSYSYAQVVQLSDLAYRRRLTINSAYVARAPMAELEAYCRQLDADVEAGRLAHDTVYIVAPEAIERFVRPGVACGTLDGFHVCVADTMGIASHRLITALSESSR